MLATAQGKLVALGVAAALAFGAGWKLRDYQDKADELAETKQRISAISTALEQRTQREQELATRSTDLETELQSLRQSKQKTQIIREKEYVEKPVYRDCVLPADGVRLLNDRVAARPAPAHPGQRQGPLP